jgi:hypothetical protein
MTLLGARVFRTFEIAREIEQITKFPLRVNSERLRKLKLMAFSSLHIEKFKIAHRKI